MKRPGFVRKPPERQPPSAPKPVKGGQVARVGDGVVSSPKEAPVRSEAYRRAVAMLPCSNCGIEGYSQRIYLEEFRKSKKALLMSECTEKAVNAREQYAYAHPEYQALLLGLKEAIEVEESLKWSLTAAQIRVDIWRSQEASNRGQDRTMR